MRYWAGTLAVSGMLVMGACSSSQTATNDTYPTPDTEGSVATEDTPYGTETTSQTTDTQSDQTGTADTNSTYGNSGSSQTTPTSEQTPEMQRENMNNQQVGSEQDSTFMNSTSGQSMYSGQASEQEQDSMKPWEDPNKRVTGIDAHVRKFSEVNDAIERVLAQKALEERENFMAQQGQQQTGGSQMATSQNMNQQQDGLSYDRMSNTQQDQTSTDAAADSIEVEPAGSQQAATNRQNMINKSEGEVSYDRMSASGADLEEGSYIVVYDAYIGDEAAELSEEERLLLEESKNQYLQRRSSNQGQLDNSLGAYYAPMVEARPDVNFDELAEEIREEMNLPDDAKAANMGGTLLVQFVVDQEGKVENAQVIDGIIGQKDAEGRLTNTMRLSESAKEGLIDEIENEDLIELSEDDRNRIVEALKAESVRAVTNTSGRWQPATQNDEPVKMVMVMPIRFSLED